MAHLPASAAKVIGLAIDALFDRIKVRYLGPNSVPASKQVVITFDPKLSLPGLYAAAAREERTVPNAKTIKALVDAAGHYLDGYRAHAKANVLKQVQSFLNEAEVSGVKTNFQTVLDGTLAETFGNVARQVKRMVDTETTTARNLGALEGITKVATAVDDSDPVVFFMVVRDGSLCEECKRVHLMPNGVTPRVWKLSEVGHDFHKKGEDFPAMSGLHPHCRCSLTYLAQGFGFDGGGRVRYVSPTHDEFKRQRG